MFSTFKKLLLAALFALGLVAGPVAAASADTPVQPMAVSQTVSASTIAEVFTSSSVNAPTAAKVIVPMAAKKKAKAKVRKCFAVCFWTYGGEIRNDHTSKKSVMISDGIDQHGKPYGNKATLKPGRNSLEKFSDTDMVYLSKKDIDNKWRLQVWQRATPTQGTSKWSTLSAKKSAGYKVANTRSSNDYTLVRAVKIK